MRSPRVAENPERIVLPTVWVCSQTFAVASPNLDERTQTDGKPRLAVFVERPDGVFVGGLDGEFVVVGGSAGEFVGGPDVESVRFLGVAVR